MYILDDMYYFGDCWGGKLMWAEIFEELSMLKPFFRHFFHFDPVKSNHESQGYRQN